MSMQAEIDALFAVRGRQLVKFARGEVDKADLY